MTASNALMADYTQLATRGRAVALRQTSSRAGTLMGPMVAGLVAVRRRPARRLPVHRRVQGGRDRRDAALGARLPRRRSLCAEASGRRHRPAVEPRHVPVEGLLRAHHRNVLRQPRHRGDRRLPHVLPRAGSERRRTGRGARRHAHHVLRHPRARRRHTRGNRERPHRAQAHADLRDPRDLRRGLDDVRPVGLRERAPGRARVRTRGGVRHRHEPGLRDGTSPRTTGAARSSASGRSR